MRKRIGESYLLGPGRHAHEPTRADHVYPYAICIHSDMVSPSSTSVADRDVEQVDHQLHGEMDL